MEITSIDDCIRLFYLNLLFEAEKETGNKPDSTIKLLTYGTVSAFVSKAMHELANEVMEVPEQAE